jgi:hypothetical protein
MTRLASMSIVSVFDLSGGIVAIIIGSEERA